MVGSWPISLTVFELKVKKESFPFNFDLLVPPNFEDNSVHLVQCDSKYFNLGVRIDTPSDTFIADKPNILAKLIPKKVRDILKGIGFALVVVFFFFFICLSIFKRRYDKKHESQDLNR